jgi:deferrochelatase/peroxidase EfeB
MGGAAMSTSTVDFSDVQGIVRFGYRKMTQAAYVLVRVKNAAAARAWLRSAPVTSAVTMNPPPTTALHVAFTSSGLKALGVRPDVIAGFSSEFLAGMTSDNRTRRLGDVGNNAPWRWQWGGTPEADDYPHLAVMFFAEPQDGGVEALMGRTMNASWASAFSTIRCLGTENLDGVEPFGFTDGISQPEIDWSAQRDASAPVLDYGNVVALGEFLLGYKNEYKKYTDRPLLDSSPATEMLLPAEDSPQKKDLGRNGTYLVMRQLRQDVRAFWQFAMNASGADAAAADRLAAAFVGRTRDGSPLVPTQSASIPGIGTDADSIRLNQFTFDSDPTGAACPFGAHIRRANPRNADYPGHPTGLAKLLATFGLGRDAFREDLMSSVRFHRILRRGREYGPGLTPEQAVYPAPPDDPERGLHFICLNANISRQFEFLQNAWIVNTKFSGMTGESDPLLGDREAIPGCPVTSDFNLPTANGLRRRVAGVPQFVTVRGGAYFFLPGLRALSYFAAEPA